MFGVDLHRHPMPQIARLQFGIADHPAIHLAEPPDIATTHRLTDCTLVSPSPTRPKEGRVWRHRSVFLLDHVVYVAVKVLHEGNVRMVPPASSGNPAQPAIGNPDL